MSMRISSDLSKVFLVNRVHTVTLNGKASDWERTRASVPQGSILGSLFFLIYINDLATDLKSNVKLFANDTSLFSIVSDLLETANILNEDLDKIRQWAEQWKMAFNRNPTKQVQEFVFLKKTLGNLFIQISILTNLWLKKCKPKSI